MQRTVTPRTGFYDFQGTSVPLSFGGLNFSDSESVHVRLRSKRGNEPLLAVEPVGKGKVIYIALSIDAQFLAVPKCAYKLLSNLLSYPAKMN
jgi:hypothetical protein